MRSVQISLSIVPPLSNRNLGRQDRSSVLVKGSVIAPYRPEAFGSIAYTRLQRHGSADSRKSGGRRRWVGVFRIGAGKLSGAFFDSGDQGSSFDLKRVLE